MEGFVFPNDVHVVWTVMIVLYPYITGLVDGAFLVCALYHCFGMGSIRPIARFSLGSAFVFLSFATAPLLVHLGRPERAFNIMVTPNFQSAMAGFGYIYSATMALLAVQLWFVLREDLIARARSDQGWTGLVCRVALLGDLHSDPETRQFDQKVVRVLAGIGIPVAVLLHGYVGFLFGSLKANPWWSTPLMFVIFICSAVVSGIAVLIFHYMSICVLNRWRIDQDCVRLMGRLLWAFMIVAVSLEILEVLGVAYKQTEEWEYLRLLISQKLFGSFVVLQYGVLSLIPFLLLGVNALARLRDSVSNLILWIASVMLLGQVLVMRWNVVIGGQILSKSYRGFTSYMPGIFEREGLAVAVTIFTLPFLILYVIHRIVPLFPRDVTHPEQTAG
ncbi:MAG: polysulfide reductase NrfD [Candidatus Riflebacteria bacterium]|nr:polysulfide reductase NrfD [Candidatus Riflebacteria bacterium]